MGFLAAIPAAIGSLLGGVGAAAAGGGLSLGTILSGVGTAVGIAGTLAQGSYQAQVAENNARIAQENATLASQRAAEEQMKADQELAGFAGQQLAQQSASGLSTSGRSAMLTRRSTARIGRADAQNIIRQGQAESRNFLQQAADFQGQAQQARTSSLFNAVGQGISGLTSLAGSAPSTRSSLGRRMQSNRIPLPNNTYTTWRPRTI